MHERLENTRDRLDTSEITVADGPCKQVPARIHREGVDVEIGKAAVYLRPGISIVGALEDTAGRCTRVHVAVWMNNQRYYGEICKAVIDLGPRLPEII